MLTTDASYAAIRNTAGVYNRGGEVLRLTGADRLQLLSWLLAKQTEFAEPGTVVESLILAESGAVDGSALVVLDEEIDHRDRRITDTPPADRPGCDRRAGTGRNGRNRSR
jgi:glycine cleavage system aminomethyltransferase T